MRGSGVRILFAAPVFTCNFFPGWMMKTGSALSIVAALFVAWQLHRRGAAQALTANSGMPLVDFHRAELMRQRDPAEVGGCVVPSAFCTGLRAASAGTLLPVSRPRADTNLGSSDHSHGRRRCRAYFRNRVAAQRLGSRAPATKN